LLDTLVEAVTRAAAFDRNNMAPPAGRVPARQAGGERGLVQRGSQRGRYYELPL